MQDKSIQIEVCTWKKCSEDNFSSYIIDRLNNDNKLNKNSNVVIKECMCLWECRKWANIRIDSEEIMNKMDPIKASSIMKTIAWGFKKPNKKKKRR